MEFIKLKYYHRYVFDNKMVSVGHININAEHIVSFDDEPFLGKYPVNLVNDYYYINEKDYKRLKKIIKVMEDEI